MILPTLKEEQKLWRQGFKFVAGIDEVGRGAWAGPVVAAAVVFPQEVKLPKDLRDSKQLSAKKRGELAEEIMPLAQNFAIAEICVTTINRVGIGKATKYAMRKAIRRLKVTPDFHLIDYYTLDYIPKAKQMGIKSGDQLCASIAAASILAKVYRDKLMLKLHEENKDYRFCDNVGYGTPYHREAIKKYGLCKYHRLSFIPGELISKIQNKLFE